jgi:hypothetical protein
MLRKMLIALGLVVAVLPYLGFPEKWDAGISTIAGVIIVLLVLISRRRTHGRFADESSTQSMTDFSAGTLSPRALHVEHSEVEDRPSMHIERDTVVDTERKEESPDIETTIEKKVTVVRRRRKKPATTPEDGTPLMPQT